MARKKQVSGINNKVLIVIVLVVVAALLVIFNSGRVSLAPGTFDYDSNNITTQYQAGQKIKGEIVIGFDEFPGNAVLASNFDNNITLLEFLENNLLSNGVEYNCSTPGCLNAYNPQGSVTSLGIDSSGKTLGFRIAGSEIDSVDSVKFRVQSDADVSFFNQIFIDILDDDQNIMINTERTNVVDSFKHDGCFDQSASFVNADITTTAICEKIELPVSPGLQLGARVINSTNGKKSILKMELRDSDGDLLDGCDLPLQTSTTQELTCISDQVVSVSEEYLVCIKAGDSNGNYDIRSETTGENCGADSFGDLINRDFEIFAKKMQFDQVNILVDDDSFKEVTGQSFGISDFIEEYIFDNFDGECQPNCMIPVEFFGQTQELSFSEVEIRYKADGGGTSLTDNQIYEISVEEPLVSSKNLVLDLEEAGFVIPAGSDEDEFELYIDGELVFSEDIDVEESFDFDVNPRFVAFGQNTLFIANSSENIISSSWDFGDGSTVQTVQDNSISHVYSDTSESSFDLEVTLKNDDNITSTKTFSIIVGSAQDIANETIKEYYQRIADVTTDVKALDSWLRDDVMTVLDLTVLNASLKSTEEDFDLASSEAEYQSVMLDLISLKVPFEVSSTLTGSNVPLVLGVDNMIVSYLEQLSSGSVENQNQLKSAIVGWMNSNLNAVTSFDQISALYDSGNEVILTEFTMNVVSKESIDEETFFVLGYGVETNGKFKSNYDQKLVGDVNYILLSAGDVNQVVEFYVLDEINPEELGAYISPSIEDLGDLDFVISGVCNHNGICDPDENENTCAADCAENPRYAWAFLWIILIIFLALIVYIILQEWYKRYYEKHLFKNKNDLYNLVNFIYNARRTGLNDGEIRKKLKSSGWSGEQIRYVFRKIDGKRTGMYEIPVFKFLENRKVKEEIKKRQKSGEVEDKFLKRKVVY